MTTTSCTGMRGEESAGTACAEPFSVPSAVCQACSAPLARKATGGGRRCSGGEVLASDVRSNAAFSQYRRRQHSEAVDGKAGCLHGRDWWSVRDVPVSAWLSRQALS